MSQKSMRALRSAILLGGTLPLVAGCVTNSPVALNSKHITPAKLSSAPEAYFHAPRASVLATDDSIMVTVVREPELSLAKVIIDADGQFDMPAVGRVTAAGRTPSEVAAEISNRLASSSYINNPQVSVNLVQADSHRVTVEGAVVNPGVFPFQTNATLLDAIALAHSPTRVAKLNQVAIFRTVGGEHSVAVFDLKLIRANRMANPDLRAGDRVVVGFSNLSQAWQDFLQAAPAIGIFSRF